MSNSPLPWFHQGLPFKCTGCGACCTGSPGYVWVTPEEIASIASHLQLSSQEFAKKYIRKVGDRFALIEKRKDSNTYDCVFLKGKKCEIYSTRPKQCQTFPWWKENLTSQEAWEEAAQSCEGINHPEAPTISLQEIEKNLSL